MKVTVIIKDFTETYLAKLEAMQPAELFEKLLELSHEKRVTMKIGLGQFRERVELNQLRREPHSITVKFAPRRGYKLVTFEFSRECVASHV